jgi:uncharacterized protein
MVFSPKNIMLIPSEACPASCSYCFGPHKGITMPKETLESAAEFIARIWDGKGGRITFHGGEPLCAGYDWFVHALEILRNKLNHRVSFSIQSNLWLLDQSFIKLFAKYAVHISTRLDGDRDICDSGRGDGYFEKTMCGIELLRRNGITPFVIATISPKTIPYISRIVDFFLKEKLPFTLRGAVPSLENGYNEYAIGGADNAKIFKSVFDYYKTVGEQMKIRDVDAVVEAVFRQHSGLCIFTNCLGQYAAIAPDGGIYSCQRFIGDKKYQLGSIFDDFDQHPDKLSERAAYKALMEINVNNQGQCGDCCHSNHCNGGCLYSAAVAKKYGKPHLFCNSEDTQAPFFYKSLFDNVKIELAKEAAARMSGSSNGGIFLAAAGDIPHPDKKRQNLERVKDLKEWSISGPPAYAFAYRARAEQLYLNVTWNCPLRCSHCAVKASAGHDDMALNDALSVLKDAKELGFREVSINGGEPLIYKHFKELIAEMAGLRKPPLIFTLYTSLFPNYEDYESLCNAFDKISVSIDGDEVQHDKRRGNGSYAKTVSHLEELIKTNNRLGNLSKIHVRASLTVEQIEDGLDTLVKNNMYDMGVDNVGISRIIPLGRGKQLVSSHTVTRRDIEKIPLRFSCGLGTHLHVAPNGKIYPCWAYADKDEPIGELKDGIKCAAYDYIWGDEAEKYCVDQNPKCIHCDVKFLCGGICRAFDDYDCKDIKEYYRKESAALLDPLK